MASLNWTKDSGYPLEASVVIPSYNGARKIPRLLDALAQQTERNFEVVVVLDGSTDNTEDVVKHYREKFLRMELITQKNGGRAVARNSGAHAANTDLLIFYDDDMEPYPDSVEKHISFHRHHAGIMCGHPLELPGVTKTDIQNYKAWLSEKWTGKYADGITVMDRDDLFFTASNCSIPRAIFDRLDGFNAKLKDAEDYELAYRALDQHIAVYYDKGNKAFHTELITCKGYVARLREYGKAHKEIASMHQRTGTARKGAGSFARSVVYRVLAFSFWVRMIDSNLLRFLPQKLRYKLYSAIIHSLANEHANVRL